MVVNSHNSSQPKSFWQNFGSGIKDFFTGLLPFGSLIDSGIGLASGISNNIYDRNLQQQIFGRDDTTLDRTMQAYQRNGLNPLLALPNATAGNTKAFEPSQIQSNFNQAYLNKMQKSSLELQDEKMRLDNAIAREDLNMRKMNNDLERQILQGKINAQFTNREDYYGNKYKLPFENAGVDYTGFTENEKLARYIHNQVIGNDLEAKLVGSGDDLVRQGLLKIDPDAKHSYIYQYGKQKFYLPVTGYGLINVVQPNGNVLGQFQNFKDAMNYAKDWANGYN